MLVVSVGGGGFCFSLLSLCTDNEDIEPQSRRNVMHEVSAIGRNGLLEGIQIESRVEGAPMLQMFPDCSTMVFRVAVGDATYRMTISGFDFEKFKEMVNEF